MGTRWFRTGVACVAALALALLLGSGAALAEETVGKWRFELKIGGVDPGDSIESDAANSYIFRSGSDVIEVRDPRPDAASAIDGRLASDPRIDIRASYGLHAFKNSELVLGVSIGYVRTRIRNLEFVYSLDIEDPQYFNEALGVYSEGCETVEYVTGTFDPVYCTRFSSDVGGEFGVEEWHYVPVNAGELTMVPVTLDLTLRFAPTKRLNPYIALGVGYLFTKLDESDQWKTLADQLDASWVDGTTARGNLASTSRNLLGEPHDLKRPEIRTENGLNLVFRGGIEWQWRPRTAFFLETAFNWAQKEIQIRVDGKPQLGKPTPTGITVGSGDARTTDVSRGGSPARIICGGVTPPEGVQVPANALCPGAGEYYFNGGTLDYGGFTWQAGVRFTL